jgi:5,10-methylenetetrahydromethanopterin reductase
MLMAIGDRSLELAGRVADAVVLHTFLTDETLARSVGVVRRAAEQAGRDPASVRVWAVLATVEESVPEEQQLRKLVGRLATYLTGYGKVLVAANGWDLAAYERFRDDPLVQGYPGAFDAIGTIDELRHLAEVLPDEWLAAAASGSAGHCARRVVDQLDAGADSVILHGATPTELAPVVEAYRAIRPDGLDALTANPGWGSR